MKATLALDNELRTVYEVPLTEQKVYVTVWKVWKGGNRKQPTMTLPAANLSLADARTVLEAALSVLDATEGMAKP